MELNIYFPYLLKHELKKRPPWINTSQVGHQREQKLRREQNERLEEATVLHVVPTALLVVCLVMLRFKAVLA